MSSQSYKPYTLKVMCGRPLLLALVLAGACGGKPVGGKAPRVDPAEAAAVAAATAALITLADPDRAKLIQERKGGDGRPGKTKENHEQVPEEVLNRSEDYALAKEYMDAKKAAEAEGLPCKKSSEEPSVEQGEKKQRLELIPRITSPDAPPKPCVKEDETDAASQEDDSKPPSSYSY